jgi:hypothetical protein
MSKKKKTYAHPFLYTDRCKTFDKRKTTVAGLVEVRSNRHHLYPRSRTDIGENCERFVLNLWQHKHFCGWNKLFQFSYEKGGIIKQSELTIDEIIELMINKDPFITRQIGSPAWKLVFKNKGLNGALDLLCRALSIKFNYRVREKRATKVIFLNPIRYKRTG